LKGVASTQHTQNDQIKAFNKKLAKEKADNQVLLAHQQKDVQVKVST